jgi:hypothetical protein
MHVMIGEIDIFGVYVPALLVLMFIAYLLNMVLTKVFALAGLYRFIWHRSVFDLAIYIVLLGIVVIVSHRLLP